MQQVPQEYETQQAQMQKMTVKSPGYGHWISSMYGWGLVTLLLLGGLGVLTWHSGTWGIIICLLIIAGGTLWLLWFTGNVIVRMYYKTRQAELNSHFFVSGPHCVGDETTHPYRHFPLSSTPDVKDESYNPAPYPKDTVEQENDRYIWNKHKKEKMIWEDILAGFDEKLGYTLSKLRTAEKRHQARLDKGETYE